MLRRTHFGARSSRLYRRKLTQTIGFPHISARSHVSTSRTDAVATSGLELSLPEVAVGLADLNSILEFGHGEGNGSVPAAPAEPAVTTSEQRRLRAGKDGNVLGWSTRLKPTDYAAAGIVPYAFKEEEGELYVLLSIQRSSKGYSSRVYTFLGGKIDSVDGKDARRTAAREAHEETHRLLCQREVLSALTGSNQACSSACASATPAAAAAAESGVVGCMCSRGKDTVEDKDQDEEDAARVARSADAGLGPGSTAAAAAHAHSQADRRGGRGGGSGGKGGRRRAGNGGHTQAGNAKEAGPEAEHLPDLGLTSAPHQNFPSGRYIAFAVHLPGAWQLPAQCEARVKARDTHPEAEKVLALEWVSFARLTELRLGRKLLPTGGGEPVRPHHFMKALLCATRFSVGVYEWLKRLRAHLRRSHGLPDDSAALSAVAAAVKPKTAGAHSGDEEEDAVEEESDDEEGGGWDKDGEEKEEEEEGGGGSRAAGQAQSAPLGQDAQPRPQSKVQAGPQGLRQPQRHDHGLGLPEALVAEIATSGPSAPVAAARRGEQLAVWLGAKGPVPEGAEHRYESFSKLLEEAVKEFGNRPPLPQSWRQAGRAGPPSAAAATTPAPLPLTRADGKPVESANGAIAVDPASTAAPAGSATTGASAAAAGDAGAGAASGGDSQMRRPLPPLLPLPSTFSATALVSAPAPAPPRPPMPLAPTPPPTPPGPPALKPPSLDSSVTMYLRRPELRSFPLAPPPPPLFPSQLRRQQQHQQQTGEAASALTAAASAATGSAAAPSELGPSAPLPSPPPPAALQQAPSRLPPPPPLPPPPAQRVSQQVAQRVLVRLPHTLWRMDGKPESLPAGSLRPPATVLRLQGVGAPLQRQPLQQRQPPPPPQQQQEERRQRPPELNGQRLQHGEQHGCQQNHQEEYLRNGGRQPPTQTLWRMDSGADPLPAGAPRPQPTVLLPQGEQLQLQQERRLAGQRREQQELGEREAVVANSANAGPDPSGRTTGGALEAVTSPVQGRAAVLQSPSPEPSTSLSPPPPRQQQERPASQVAAPVAAEAAPAAAAFTVWRMEGSPEQHHSKTRWRFDRTCLTAAPTLRHAHRGGGGGGGHDSGSVGGDLGAPNGVHKAGAGAGAGAWAGTAGQAPGGAPEPFLPPSTSQHGTHRSEQQQRSERAQLPLQEQRRDEARQEQRPWGKQQRPGGWQQSAGREQGRPWQPGRRPHHEPPPTASYAEEGQQSALARRPAFSFRRPYFGPPEPQRPPLPAQPSPQQQQHDEPALWGHVQMQLPRATMPTGPGSRERPSAAEAAFWRAPGPMAALPAGGRSRSAPAAVARRDEGAAHGG